MWFDEESLCEELVFCADHRFVQVEVRDRTSFYPFPSSLAWTRRMEPCTILCEYVQLIVGVGVLC